MDISARIAVFTAVEIVLLVTPLMFPQIPPRVGYAAYALALLLFLLGAGYLVGKQWFSTDRAKGARIRGFVKAKRGTSITSKKLQYFVSTNTDALWVDNEIARSRQQSVSSTDSHPMPLLADLLKCVKIETFEILERELRRSKSGLVRLATLFPQEGTAKGDCLMQVFYWVGAEQGAEKLSKVVQDVPGISGNLEFYRQIVFARHQLKPLKDPSKLLDLSQARTGTGAEKQQRTSPG